MATCMQANHNSKRNVTLRSVLFVAIQMVALVGCRKTDSDAPVPAPRDVVGLTEAELRARYPEVTELDNSFSLLVSKNLHPYHPPATNKVLRFGKLYLVAELKDGKVIALHRVSG